MANCSSTDWLKYVVDGHNTGASDASLYVRPARIAVVSLFKSSAASSPERSSGILLHPRDEIGERLADLVELDQERIVPVHAFDLHVLTVAAGRANEIGDVARLVVGIEHVAGDAHRQHGNFDARDRGLNTATAAADVV